MWKFCRGGTNTGQMMHVACVLNWFDFCWIRAPGTSCLEKCPNCQMDNIDNSVPNIIDRKQTCLALHMCSQKRHVFSGVRRLEDDRDRLYETGWLDALITPYIAASIVCALKSPLYARIFSSSNTTQLLQTSTTQTFHLFWTSYSLNW